MQLSPGNLARNIFKCSLNEVGIYMQQTKVVIYKLGDIQMQEIYKCTIE